MANPAPHAKETPFDVFICHSSNDKTTADAVCAALEAAGIRCWIAPRDILPGVDWSGAIVEALSRCRLLVLIFSANANESVQIRNEVVQAVNDGLTIVPFRIEATNPSKSLAYFISGVHWLDALTPPMEKHLQTLVGTVRVLLGAAPIERLLQESEAGSHTGAHVAGGAPAGAKPVRRAGFRTVAALAAALVIAIGGGTLWLMGEHHGANSEHAVVVFNLPTEQDLARIQQVASDHALILPEIAFRPPAGSVSGKALRFIGVWSSEIGFNGVGRHAMLIVTTVSSDMRAEGYILLAPSNGQGYDPASTAFTLSFRGEIAGDAMSVKPENAKVTYTAELNLRADAMTLIANRPDHKVATIVLKPLWRMAIGA